MVGQGHQSDQHEFDPTLGGSGRQEGLVALVRGVTKSRTRLNDNDFHWPEASKRTGLGRWFDMSLEEFLIGIEY